MHKLLFILVASALISPAQAQFTIIDLSTPADGKESTLIVNNGKDVSEKLSYKTYDDAAKELASRLGVLYQNGMDLSEYSALEYENDDRTFFRYQYVMRPQRIPGQGQMNRPGGPRQGGEGGETPMRQRSAQPTAPSPSTAPK